MRLWLLLASLLVSDLSPPGHGACVMDYFSWRLCRKLFFSRQMAPMGMKMLLTQASQHWMCIQRNCVYVAVQHKQRNIPLNQPWDHGRHLPHQERTEILSGHFPIKAVFHLHKEEKTLPDTLPAVHVINRDTSTEAAISNIAVDAVKNCPDSWSVRLVNHHSAALGLCVQAFLLEKSKIRAPATIAQWHKMLTKTYGAAATVIISRCLRELEIGPAMDIKKISRRHMADRTQETDIEVLKQYDGQPSLKAPINQHDILCVATLYSKTSEVQKNAASNTKENQHLNLDEESTLQHVAQKQLSLKAASGGHGDGFHMNIQLLLISRGGEESIKRSQHKLRAAQDDNKHFNGKMITEQVELRRPEGENKAEEPHTNTIKTGNQKGLENIPQSAITEEGKEDFIVFFLSATQTEQQTEPSSARKQTLSTDMRWKTIKQLGDPPSVTKVRTENFIIKPDDSTCKCLKVSILLLEMHWVERAVSRNIKPAESTTSASTDEKVREATEEAETNNTPRENISINHTKQGENIPSGESVILSTPANIIMQTEMMETTTVNMEIKETTSRMEVFNQDSTQKAAGLLTTEETSASAAVPEPKTDSEPRLLKCKTNNAESRMGKPQTGLRMRVDIPGVTATPRKGEEKDGETSPTHRPETTRTVNPLQMIHEQSTGNFHNATHVPPCRGLIHRTDAGWKHCVERSAGSSREPRERAEEHESIRHHKDNSFNDVEYDHFYYFDGVLKRVQSNFYPYYKRRTQNGVRTVRTKKGTQVNLLSYIKHLALRNKVSDFLKDQEG